MEESSDAALALKNYDNVSGDINIYDSDFKGGFRVAHKSVRRGAPASALSVTRRGY